MDVHQNARTTPHGRFLMIRRLPEGWSVAAVAAAFGVDAKTVRKWRDRYAAEGEAGLADRSSRPHHSPTRLGEPARPRSWRCDAGACRAQPSPDSSAGPSPPWAWSCAGAGSPARRPRPQAPAIRYQREQPGELIHRA